MVQINIRNSYFSRLFNLGGHKPVRVVFCHIQNRCLAQKQRIEHILYLHKENKSKGLIYRTDVEHKSNG